MVGWLVGLGWLVFWVGWVSMHLLVGCLVGWTGLGCLVQSVGLGWLVGVIGLVVMAELVELGWVGWLVGCLVGWIGWGG